MKVSLSQPTPSEFEPFRERGTELLEFALFQGIYANWTKMTYFDQYNENIGQHSKKRKHIRKNECGHNRSHFYRSVEDYDQDIL